MGYSARNAFKIVVTLSGNLKIQTEQHTLQYKFSRSHTDTLTISSNTITISGTRSQKPSFDDVFKNNKSEVYLQFIKSYVYYSISNGVIPKIKSITCYDKNNDVEITYTKDDIVNLKPKTSTSILKKISRTKLAVIFKSTNEGLKYLYATTTLIRSLCSDDYNDVFEKLWKSYNSIYRVLSTRSQEWQCLEDMGNIMLGNPSDFPLSSAHAATLTKSDVLSKTRWYAMLENKFITRMNLNSRESRFSSFLTKYHDHRLVEMANDTIDFKKNFWTSQITRTNTLTTIQARLATPAQVDIEIVDVLSNYYMYYLRNKILHGEQADYSFRFIPYNKESITLKFSSELLILIIFDLINNNNF